MIAEAASLAAGLALTTWAIFGDATGSRHAHLTILVLPFVIWAAFRFRQREVTTLTATVSGLAIIYTIQGNGPFATESLNLSLLLLLAFMSTVAMTGLVLNAVVRERARITVSLNEALRQLRTEAITDPLTGLYNRRFLEDYLHRELARAERSGFPVAVIMLDLDHFKRVNDERGHAAGDAVLEAIGALLKRHFRAGDVACRYGGEEFMLVLHDTQLGDARRKADTIRADVERSPGALSGVTASLGIAMYPDHATDPSSLMGAADGAMYEAKTAGRNRVATTSARASFPSAVGRSGQPQACLPG